MKNKGVTLTEVLTAIILTVFMFGMILAVMILVRKNYLEQEKRSSMQQNAATALSRLTKEIMESSYTTVTIYNPTGTTPPAGIIFASAREPALNNKFDLEADTAKIVWHKYVCYYIDTDPENSSEKALFRKEKEITETTTAAPSPDSTLTFKNDATLKYTIIAHRVDDINFPDLGVGTFGPSQVGAALPLKVSLTLAEMINTPSQKNSVTVSFTVNMHN